jgi:hypothetical protein
MMPALTVSAICRMWRSPLPESRIDLRIICLISRLPQCGLRAARKSAMSLAFAHHAGSAFIDRTLTAHQRRVLVAIVIDGVPIDVLADRLGSTRNALYKTLHDARKRLRHDLVAHGLVDPTSLKETTRLTALSP